MCLCQSLLANEASDRQPGGRAALYERISHHVNLTLVPATNTAAGVQILTFAGKALSAVGKSAIQAYNPSNCVLGFAEGCPCPCASGVAHVHAAPPSHNS